MRTDMKKQRGSIFDQPVLSVVQNHLVRYPTPSNLNSNYNWGALAGLCQVLQIVTGIFQAMHYTAHVDLAFHSVQHLMRDVPNGWLLRYLHANGASLFFVVVYRHLFRALYYTSYASPREFVWLIGVVILLVMILTAFIGYVLPWGRLFAPNEQLAVLFTTFYKKEKKDKVFKQEYSAFYTPRIQAKSRYGPHKKEINDLIVGIMLGDGHMEKHGLGCRFTLHMGAKSQELVEHIHNLLANNGYCSPKKPESKPAKPNKKTGKVYHTVHLKTYTFGSFEYYHNEWYYNNIKVIPASLEHDLTRRALVYWFMADGNYTGFNFNIRTYSFTESEVEQQAAVQRKKFNLKAGKCYNNKEKNWWKVIIYAESVPQFVKLVRPYIGPCMLYKLPILSKSEIVKKAPCFTQ